MFIGFIIPAFVTMGLLYLYNIQTTTKYKVNIALGLGIAAFGWFGAILVALFWCIYLLNLMIEDSVINKKFKGE